MFGENRTKVKLEGMVMMKRVYIEYKLENGLFEAPELHTLELDVPAELPSTSPRM